MMLMTIIMMMMMMMTTMMVIMMMMMVMVNGAGADDGHLPDKRAVLRFSSSILPFSLPLPPPLSSPSAPKFSST